MKIYSNLPDVVKNALRENIPAAEFVDNPKNADITLPELPLPVRIGELLEIIENLQSQTVKRGGLSINLTTRKISRDGLEIDITEKEADILSQLIKSATPQSREDLLKSVWNYADDANTKTVETHIYRLRNKIADVFAAELIITENGNYRLLEN